MSALRKVIWAEGAILTQQHFQRWDKQIEIERGLSRYYCQPHQWGLAKIQFDEALLSQGKLSLTHLDAMLPDRRWLHFDNRYDGEIIRLLPEEKKETIPVFIGLSSGGKVNHIAGYNLPENFCSTWNADYQPVQDDYDVEREREVLLAKQNIQLFFANELSDELSRIKVAELKWNFQNLSYEFCVDYIPPVIQLGASSHFTDWLKQLLSKIIKQIRILSEQKEKHRQAHNKLSYSDLIYFNLLKTLSSVLPRLKAYQLSPLVHPITLYETLCDLLGELSAYSDISLLEAEIRPYDHQQLNAVFTEIGKQLEMLLEEAMPANSIDIALHKISDWQFETDLLSKEQLEDRQFCLAIHNENFNENFIDKIQTQIKMTAPSKIQDIVQTFTKGIEIKYLKSPGKDINAKRNYHYFSINKHSPSWQDILSESRIAFFVNQELSVLPFELISY